MEMTNIVKINGEEYKVKNTIRALFVFEQIAGKPFAIEGSLDNFLFLYSVILANNPDKMISWETFIDAMDSDPKLLDAINSILKEAREIEDLMEGEKEEAGEEDENVKKK